LIFPLVAPVVAQLLPMQICTGGFGRVTAAAVAVSTATLKPTLRQANPNTPPRPHHLLRMPDSSSRKKNFGVIHGYST
jgi:hypothetical protein